MKLLLISLILIFSLNLKAATTEVQSAPELNQETSQNKSYRIEAYGESQYAHRFDSFQANYKIELISKVVVPGSYVGIFHSFDDRPDSNPVETDEYLALKVGWKTKLFQYFGVFSEFRRLVYQPDISINDKKDDLRLGLYGYYDTNLARKLKFETYGEAVYSSRVYEDTFFAAYGRLFNTIINSEKFQVGPFVELFGKRDTKGFFYENLEEGRYGVRGVYRRPKYSLALNIFGVRGHYSDREYRDANPYSKNYDDFRTLLVFYGEI